MKRLILLLLFPLCVSAQTNDYSAKFRTIDTYANGLLQQWNIPGMAIALVHKDKLIYSKGYGFQDLEKKLPATATTLFPIASNTKLFTSTIASQLDIEGKLNYYRLEGDRFVNRLKPSKVRPKP